MPFTSAKNSSSSDSKNVLVIEDDPSMAEIVLMGLSLAGYTGVHTADVNNVLELLKSRKFVAIICDVNLNSKKSGIDIFYEVDRASLHNGLFIFMTGDTIDWARIERSTTSKLSKPIVFFKPITVSRIVSIINDHVRSDRTDISATTGIGNEKVGKLDFKQHDERHTSAKVEVLKPSMNGQRNILRHELANKVMIAYQNAEIALLLLNKSSDVVGVPKSDILKRIETSIKSLDKMAGLLDEWRQSEKTDDE